MRTTIKSIGRAAMWLVLSSTVALSHSAAATTDLAAVFASTANGYQRERQADGTFKPETFAFAEGGRWDNTLVDSSIDDVTFLQVARALVGPLQRQNFVQSTRASDTQLMIMVFWGTTLGAEKGQYTQGHEPLFDALEDMRKYDPLRGGYLDRVAQNLGPAADPYLTGDARAMIRGEAIDRAASSLMLNQAANAMRDRNNSQNAVILGFWEEYNRAHDLPGFNFTRTVLEELEADRYFVVLKAYDFQAMRNERKKVLLWETRFSIRQRNNRFDQILPTMTLTASKYFGQRSGRLLREIVPVGRVEMGEPTVVPTGR